MNYWLFKSEPSVFSIDDLAKRPNQTEPWEGVRNFEARNFLHFSMKAQDLAFFYHSSCDIPGIVGIVRVVGEPRPDTTAFDPESPYYAPKSIPAIPLWWVRDIQFVQKFPKVISLRQLKKHPELQTMRVVKPFNRLSITPVSKAEWDIILTLVNDEITA